MAQRKLNNPYYGYINLENPTSPVIKNDQFGVPRATTNPENVPLIQQLSAPVIQEPILNAYGESLDVGDTVIYTLESGTTLMITGFILATMGIGAITEANETTLWVCKTGGDSGTGTSKRLAFVPATSITGASNIVQMTFPVPIALNSSDWATINMNQQDTDTHDRAQLFGYVIRN